MQWQASKTDVEALFIHGVDWMPLWTGRIFQYAIVFAWFMPTLLKLVLVFMGEKFTHWGKQNFCMLFVRLSNLLLRIQTCSELGNTTLGTNCSHSLSDLSIGLSYDSASYALAYCTATVLHCRKTDILIWTLSLSQIVTWK